MKSKPFKVGLVAIALAGGALMQSSPAQAYPRCIDPLIDFRCGGAVENWSPYNILVQSSSGAQRWLSPGQNSKTYYEDVNWYWTPRCYTSKVKMWGTNVVGPRWRAIPNAQWAQVNMWYSCGPKKPSQ